MKNSARWRLLGISLLTITPAARAASPFDGNYVGTQRETVNNHSGFCENLNRDDLRRTIKDGIIRTEWGKVTLQATVGSDGSFLDQEEGMQYGRAGSGPNPIQLKGTIRNGKLEADVGGAHCAVHWSLQKY